MWAALCVLVLCWFYVFPGYRLPSDKEIVEEVLRQGEVWHKNQTGIDLYRFVSGFRFHSGALSPKMPPAVLKRGPAGPQQYFPLVYELCTGGYTEKFMYKMFNKSYTLSVGCPENKL